MLNIRVLATFFVLILTIACSDSLGPAKDTAEPPGDATVSVSLNVSSASQIAAVHLLVTGADLPDTLRFVLSLESGIARGTATVPAGPRRTFTLRALDASGITWYEGSATVDVVPGQNPLLTITLYPVDPAGVVPIVGQIGSYSVTIVPAVDTVRVGEFVSFTATVRDAGGNLVDSRFLGWNSFDAKVAHVIGHGNVLGYGPGRTQIMAHNGGDLRAMAEVVVIE